MALSIGYSMDSQRRPNQAVVRWVGLLDVHKLDLGKPRFVFDLSLSCVVIS